ncbi:transglycosylase domain-containing protein [Mucilaginibacter antarcticus]|uniref:Transglycosylase domain-containing protein n=1 Tax=Mucilaginibacter antarcticus TaxID=1855725 RepID=A0ABW5XL76_9SPHI
MRRLNPKHIRIAVIVAVSLIVLLLIGGFIAYGKREAILQSQIAKAKLKAKRQYNLNLQIGSAHFSGLTTISCKDIIIVPQNRDTLLNVKRFEVSIKLLPLLFGNIKLADVYMDDALLNLTDIKGVRNFDFLFKKKQDSVKTNTKLDLSELSNNLIKQVLYKIPDNLNVSNFLVSFKNDSARLKLLTETAKIDDGDLTSTVKINDTVATWHFSGIMHPSDKEIDVKLYADNGKVEIPFIEKRFGAKVNFDNLTVKLTNVKHSNGETKIATFCSAHNLLINHPAFAANNVIVPDGSIAADFLIGTNYISLDSSSVIHLKKASAHPYLKYTLKPVKTYELRLSTGWQDAQNIFDSFPTGMFESLEGIKAQGKLNYSLNFFLDKSMPDNLRFDSKMEKDADFKIVRYGRTDLSKLNKTFVYTPYEYGKPMRPHVIGPENPEYTPLEEMSPYLRNAVMTAEDPTFYKHRGFVEKSIRASIVTNIKKQEFSRGGSTISMQLVKNAFLTRKKTLSRKIEEILIVWLIENNNIITKDRMLEVYFNIIEWGPGIYGISEASHYYFGKSPSELNLGESIYLAKIVPRPKAGLYAFLPDGSLRPGLERYFNSLGRMMMGRGFAQQDSNSYGFYTIRLREGLRQRIESVDSTEANQILNSPRQDDVDLALPQIEDPEPSKKPNFLQRIFGKRDTVTQHTEQMLEDEEERRINAIDETGKSGKQIRQAKRAIRNDIKAKKKALEAQGKL